MKNKKMVKLPQITDIVAQQVWMLTELNDKKLFLLDYMGEACNTDVQQNIRNKIQNARSGKIIDTIVTNMMLKTQGLGS